MKISDSIQEMVLEHKSGPALRDEARKEGMKTMKESALAKAVQGLTTAEEILRVIYVAEQ